MTENPASTEALPVLKTVEEFEAWERLHPTEGSYEFVRGRIIKKESMKQDEVPIAGFLVRQFIKTPAFRRGDELMPEADSYVDGYRRHVPDLTYFTAEQLKAIRLGTRANTLFAIEILSDSETYQEVLDKIQDYFDGGAKLCLVHRPEAGEGFRVHVTGRIETFQRHGSDFRRAGGTGFSVYGGGAVCLNLQASAFKSSSKPGSTASPLSGEFSKSISSAGWSGRYT
jgi:Uma2 family endonuclease